MTIYEPEDFKNIWNPEAIRTNRAIDSLKKIKAKQAHDNKKKLEDGIPTPSDLETWFYSEDVE